MLRQNTTSTCMALLDKQVYTVPLFWLLPTILYKKEPNKYTPQYINGDFSVILSLGKSANFCCWSLSLNCLHLTHFKMIQLTKPRSYILSSQNLRTLFGLLSCLDQHELIVHDTSVLPTQKIWILPPTLNILSSSMNRSNFTMLLHNFKRFPFSQGYELFSKVSSLDRFDYLLLCHLYSFQVQWYTMLLCVIQFFSRPVSSNAFMQLLLKP